MKIVVGKYAGFCPGVLNSVTKASEVTDNNKEVYCLGELIHNQIVIKELEDKGMITIESLNEVPNEKIVLFRAHGVKESIYNEAKEKDLKVIDLTCAIVKSIHNKVSDAKKDSFVVIIGDKKHPENIGTKDFAGDNSMVISLEEELDILYEEVLKTNLKKVYVVSQTTFNLKKFEELSLLLKDKFKDFDLKIDNTICKATELRQKEVEELSKDNDVIIVVGGKNSSNTKKLYDISSKNCKRVYHIENVLELENEVFGNELNIAIVAGASTPKKIINEVKEYLENK